MLPLRGDGTAGFRLRRWREFSLPLAATAQKGLSAALTALRRRRPELGSHRLTNGTSCVPSIPPPSRAAETVSLWSLADELFGRQRQRYVNRLRGNTRPVGPASDVTPKAMRPPVQKASLTGALLNGTLTAAVDLGAVIAVLVRGGPRSDNALWPR